LDDFTRPRVAADEVDPRIDEQPQISDMTEQEFEIEFQRFVRRLTEICNWHEHTDTCWKHLHPGEPKNDVNCRMRIDGSTRALTEIDPTTLSVLLRRLHPRINNYHELVIFLVQCNMDIKYIGSGPAAKALVFYVTDYITKSSLSVHVGLDAIKYALRGCQYVSTADDPLAKEKALFVKSVNTTRNVPPAGNELSHWRWRSLQEPHIRIPELG
jgi:hypothetical protein